MLLSLYLWPGKIPPVEKGVWLLISVDEMKHLLNKAKSFIYLFFLLNFPPVEQVL